MRWKIEKMDSRGFTLAEVLIASMVLLIALLSIATMFPMGYKQVVDAGRMTTAVSGARQILEDVGALPFASVINLNGFDTTNPATLPAADPELAVARRWAYMAAGAANGFTFTAAELAQYGSVTPFGGQASIQVASPSTTLRQATVTVSVSGLPTSVQLITIIVSMF
jgi:prepilin-type N-terminal cleavage/methylation domain-containing protein